MAAVPVASATAARLAEANNANVSGNANANAHTGVFNSQQAHQVKVSNPKATSWLPVSASKFSVARHYAPQFDGSRGSRPAAWRSPVNEVAVDESSNEAVVSAQDSGVPSLEEKKDKTLEQDAPRSARTDASVSAFMTEVANLIKLVDSRDIMELQLKQQDCEVLIRKKEALPQPPIPPPPVMGHSPYPAAAAPPPIPSAVPAPPSSAVVPAGPSAPAQPPSPPKSGQSDYPPMKCPMAGTFYCSPGPGEPPFVKIGDKVQKGQVICIVEAMKLMNEIEADQSGTIIDILVEDGKPVGVDMPLFVIKP